MDAHNGLKRYAIVIIVGLGVLGSTVSHSQAQGSWNAGPWSMMPDARKIYAPPPPVQPYESLPGQYGTYTYHDYGPTGPSYRAPSNSDQTIYYNNSASRPLTYQGLRVRRQPGLSSLPHKTYLPPPLPRQFNNTIPLRI